MPDTIKTLISAGPTSRNVKNGYENTNLLKED